jgi:cellulose synthase (UDP-forming)
MSDVTQLLAASQIVKAVLHGLIKPKGHKFHVTAKGGDRSRGFVQWPLLRVFLAYLGLTVAGVVWAFLFEDGTKLRDSSALCLFWSWYNIVVLTIACVVCVEQPRYRSGERLAARNIAIVEAGADAFEHRILDVSVSGARLAGAPAAKPGATVTITFEGIRALATIVRCGPDDFAVRFSDTDAARADLIRLIYSGRFSTTVTRIEPTRVAAAILKRVMR